MRHYFDIVGNISGGSGTGSGSGSGGGTGMEFMGETIQNADIST